MRRLSQPPACTLESCPESPIATTFTPDSTAAEITAADRRVCAIVASSRISTAGFWLTPWSVSSWKKNRSGLRVRR